VSRRIRNMFLLLGVAGFLASALGITLYLHLAHEDDPAKHDVAHCSLCQQLLIAKKEYTVETEPAPIEMEPTGRVVALYATPLFQQCALYQCSPRAPPG
jgi:hypothetical protein